MTVSRDFSTARSRDLGRQAAMIRERAGYSMMALAKEIGTGAPTLSRFEAGHRGLSDVKFIQYLTLCGLKSEDIDPLIKLSRAPDDGRHFADFSDGAIDDLIALIVHETTAKTIREYENNVIPGLLQAFGYARALIGEGGIESTDAIQKCVRRRLDRQSVLHGENPPLSTFYISEHVLRSMVGSAEVMHDQMMRLYFAAQWDNCSIRVVPADEYGRTCAPASFRLMTFADSGPVASQDLMTGMVFLERPRDIAVYREALERIDRVALSGEQTLDLIVTLADDYAWMEVGRHERGAAGEVVDVAAE